MELSSEYESFLRRTRRYLDLGYDRRRAARTVADGIAPVRGGAPVLDIGTGKGLLAIALAERLGRVISVDLDRQELPLAATLAEEAGVRSRIAYLTLDATALAFAAGQFDCVAMMDVLHHLDSAESVLAEMVRVLRPEGCLVLADFTAEGFALVARVHRESGTEHQVGAATVDRAAEWLRSSGFLPCADRTEELHRIVVLSRPARATPPLGRLLEERETAP